MGLEELWLIDGLEEGWDARPRCHGEHGVSEPSGGDEDGDAGVAGEIEQEGGGEGREALQDRGQREAFGRVVQAGPSGGADGGHGTSP